MSFRGSCAQSWNLSDSATVAPVCHNDSLCLFQRFSIPSEPDDQNLMSGLTCSGDFLHSYINPNFMATVIIQQSTTENGGPKLTLRHASFSSHRVLCSESRDTAGWEFLVPEVAAILKATQDLLLGVRRWR